MDVQFTHHIACKVWHLVLNGHRVRCNTKRKCSFMLHRKMDDLWVLSKCWFKEYVVVVCFFLCDIRWAMKVHAYGLAFVATTTWRETKNRIFVRMGCDFVSWPSSNVTHAKPLTLMTLINKWMGIIMLAANAALFGRCTTKWRRTLDEIYYTCTIRYERAFITISIRNAHELNS